jgi:hypothetical protein
VKAFGWKLVGIGIALLTVLGAGLFLYLRFRGAKVVGMEAALRAAKASADIRVLEARKDTLKAKVGTHDTTIAALDAQIADVREQRRSVKQDALLAKGKTMAEVDRELADMGF